MMNPQNWPTKISECVPLATLILPLPPPTNALSLSRSVGLFTLLLLHACPGRLAATASHISITTLGAPFVRRRSLLASRKLNSRHSTRSSAQLSSSLATAWGWFCLKNMKTFAHNFTRQPNKNQHDWRDYTWSMHDSFHTLRLDVCLTNFEWYSMSCAIAGKRIPYSQVDSAACHTQTHAMWLWWNLPVSAFFSNYFKHG